MKNKPGFKGSIGGETIVYLVIGIIVFICVFFMPNIYKFISDFKTGNLFKKTNTPVVENNDHNNGNEREDKTTVEPTGETVLTCTLSISKPEGNQVETYNFYYNEDKLESFSNTKDYDSATDDYLNYIYSEQARFNNMNNLYKNVSGFSYDSELDARTLKVTFVYDMTKLNPEFLKSSDETLSINLNVSKNQTLEEVKTIYTDLGYNCR